MKTATNQALNTGFGLSESEAQRRLEEEGPNELPSHRHRRALALALEVVREPMVFLLLGCGAIYFTLGDKQEAVSLLGFLVVILAITIYQERKTENAIEALKNLSSPRALVVRDGRERRIAGRDVVRDDILILSEGDRVPADAKLLSGANLRVDESLLTGESVPVQKSPAMGPAPAPKESLVFAGTSVVSGHAKAQTFATGPQTEMGRIGRAIQSAKPESTRLQRETRHLVRVLAVFALALCVLVVVTYALTRGDWLNGFLSGLTLAMAILPNELPAVLMIFLALGSWRISQKRVLTRKSNAIENLGSATVLCVDKTGTLTLNRMAVRKLFSSDSGEGEYDLFHRNHEPLPEAYHRLVEFGILASSPRPFDPMEQAVHGVGETYLAQTEHLHPDWTLEREYPLTPELLAVSYVWRSDPQGAYFIGAKGAPEAIADLCHMNATDTKTILEKADQFARQGLRVLGVAKSVFPHRPLPRIQHDYDFQFLGLIGLADPVRPGVPHAIEECHRAGIRVIMITGDYAQTATSIAREIGLEHPDQVVTGAEIERMNDDELSRSLKAVNCFARMVPEQKLRLVEALQRNGETVAMTGDGVNDAPALKAAQIGIAMGGRGTDVARESASIVLLDDDFASIVEAVRSGRRIFDNLKSAMAYLLAAHVPIAGMSVVPVLMKLPLVLMPVHIAFLHLIIEPACSVVFEAEPIADDAMRRPPRGPDQPLFSRGLILPSLAQGLVAFAIVLAVFLIALARGHAENDARALTFTTLIFANLGLILVNRSWSRSLFQGLRVSNRSLWWVLFASLGILFAVLYVPILRELFRFSLLHPMDLFISVTAGLASIIWFEGWKLLRRRSLEPVRS